MKGFGESSAGSAFVTARKFGVWIAQRRRQEPESQYLETDFSHFEGVTATASRDFGGREGIESFVAGYIFAQSGNILNSAMARAVPAAGMKTVVTQIGQ